MQTTCIVVTLAVTVTTLFLLARRQWRRTSSLERNEQAAAETKGTTLCALGDDVLCLVFEGLRNPLEPRVAVDFGSASHGLWALTQALRRQLKAEYEAAAALCLKVGMRSCKELREATMADWIHKGLSAVELATLGTLGSVLPKLKLLHLYESSGAGGPDGVQRLAERLGAGALPAVTMLVINSMHVGDAGASALAAALARGALPRLKCLVLDDAAIGNAGVVAIAPALRLSALKHLFLPTNPFGDEGLAALVVPGPPASALSPRAVLPKLQWLDLRSTQVSDAGCAVLAAALHSGALPALSKLYLAGIPASVDAKTAVRRAGLEQWDCALCLQNPLGV